jgi:hypothetical protein
MVSFLWKRLSKDITTVIFSHLCSQDRAALLSAYPELGSKIDWGTLYYQKYNPLALELRQIYDKHFSIKKETRLKAMLAYYNATDVTKNWDIDEECEEYYDLDHTFRNIPIIDDDFYKLQDYVYSITDDIYDEIRLLKGACLSTPL